MGLGIAFRDISTLLADPFAFAACIDGLARALEGVEFSALAGTVLSLVEACGALC